ncbi:hypothetical protein Vadar_012593 [Vaccinium darrowii]|uniref:Uncharacterized protein n=1 Tax=Vaccinium darrowii TaxID=229202 RepID=A0ACB7X9F8_9ERIC|nr:hypothetical protein Vadar_012593 [Vaccinium darrowii]
MAMKCFKFEIRHQRWHNVQGKLVTAMISALGRLGKVDLARYVFDFAIKDRYGNTIYIYSALISAYAKSGCCDEAIKVFDTMKAFVLNPNLVTYNALIDVDRGHRDAMVAVNLKSSLWWSPTEPGIPLITYTCNNYPEICTLKGGVEQHCCNEACVDVKTDRLNCGECGHKCKPGVHCCQGDCVSLMKNRHNCGKCGNKCGDKEKCCYGKCVHESRDPMNCGKCGHKCAFGESCCKRKCVNLQTDKKHCGKCHKKCHEDGKCETGMCSYAS